MCPSRPRPPGVVDCYTVEGMCARNSTCAPLLLGLIECITDTGFKNTTDCQDAHMRMHDYVLRNRIPMNCTCITSPVQCKKFKAALGMPVKVSTAYDTFVIVFACMAHLKAALVSMHSQSSMVSLKQPSCVLCPV